MKKISGCLAVLVGLLLAGTGANAAVAATDRQGPTLKVPAAARFVLGQQVADPYDLYGDGDLTFMTEGATMEYPWTATDSSGICRYTVHEEHTAEGWYAEPVLDRRTHAGTGRYSYLADEYYNSDDLSQIRITAYDCKGNKTTVVRRPSYLHVLRDHGPSLPAGWARTSCTCAIGDSMARTSTRKAALSSLVNAGGQTQHVALVMAKGPARGRASVYVDGVYRATVDTYAAGNVNRVVVWEAEFAGTADHTITVVNQATAGRPRIDVDAVLQSVWG